MEKQINEDQSTSTAPTHQSVYSVLHSEDLDPSQSTVSEIITTSVLNEFFIKTERVKNLVRLQRAAAFSIFPNIQNPEQIIRNAVKCDFKVYDLNNRVIFYVSSTTAVTITKDGPFCLKLINKDLKSVAKFLRDKPRNSTKNPGFFHMFGCCSLTKDVMEILDDVGNQIAKAFFNTSQTQTEILIKDSLGQILLRVQNSKEHQDVFFAVDNDRYLGEIRQKIISTGNSIDNYKGVCCWFSTNIDLDVKLLFLAAAFILEIDYFSETEGRKFPSQKHPEVEYLIPVVKTPPYHQRVRIQAKSKKKPKKATDKKVEEVISSRDLSKVMPEIHHTKNFAPIDDKTEKTEKSDKVEANEDLKTADLTTKDHEYGSDGMNREQFRNAGKKVLDYLVKQDEMLKNTRCTPAVKPGYLKSLIPGKAPLKAEDIDEILDDYHQLIIPGLSQSDHPNFNSFYSCGNAFHCLLSELLGGHMGDSGFSWTANPALNELEVIMMDWLGDMMGLPREMLLFPDGSRGGGCMQHSSSESILLALSSARNQMIKEVQKWNNYDKTSDIAGRLIAYTSSEAQSAVLKAAEIAMVNVHVLQADENFSLRGDTLYSVINNDRQQGLIPFFVSATFGTTGPCSFDSLHELGPICRDNGLWLHVDASYAGSAMICPETRVLMRGIEWADSFACTPSKLVIAVCDVNCMWVQNRFKLQTPSADGDKPFKGLPTSRRYGALKMWFFLRTMGIDALQKQIREHIRLAAYFADKMKKDDRFEICNRVVLGVVCFRAKAGDNFNMALLYRLNETGRISLASCILNNKFVLRLCVNSPRTTEEILNSTVDLICSEIKDLKPFQPNIDQMSKEELEEYIKPNKKSAEAIRKSGVPHPFQLGKTISASALLDVKENFIVKTPTLRN